MKQLLLYIFVALFVASCGDSYEEKVRLSREERQKQKTEDSLALKFAVLPTADCLPIYVAKEKRLFDTLGVDVRLRCFTSQMDCDTAIAGGSVEGVVSDLVRTARLRRGGTALHYLSSTNAYWQLIANRRARLKRLNQFGDKMIAMTRYSATDFFTDHFLKHVKTSAIVFRIQVNDVFIREKMILNNEMDAAWLAEPFATAARLTGNPIVADSRDFQHKPGVIALRSRSIEDSRRKKQVTAFVKAYNAACDSLNTYGLSAYKDVLYKYYKVDASVVSAMPRMKFDHISKPFKVDVDAFGKESK